jgi:hypothetical protein
VDEALKARAAAFSPDELHTGSKKTFLEYLGENLGMKKR